MSHRAPGAAPRTALSGKAPWQGLALALITFAGFVAAHPWPGIVHDNALYAAQAFRSLDPAAFDHDLFFAFGSQDSFTVFSPIYGSLIALLGLGTATRLLLVCGQLLWLACAFQLIRQLVPQRFTWLALLILVTYPGTYGGLGVFQTGEPFLTPRLFSEALGIGAIAAFLSARAWLSVVLLLVATLLHPLVAAAPAGALLVLWLFRTRPMWTSAAAIAVASLLLLLALLGVHLLHLPFPPTMDAEWRTIVAVRSPHLFIAKWSPNDWMNLMADAVLIILAASVAPPAVRRLFVVTLTIGAASVLVSFVAFDVLGDALAGQLQVWRALWLLKVLAPVSLSLIIANVEDRHSILARPMRLIACSTPMFAALSGIVFAPGLLLAPTVLLAVLFARDRKGAPVGKALGRLVRLSYVVYGLFCVLALLLLGHMTYMLATESGSFTVLPAWRFMLPHLLPLSVLAFGLWLFLGRHERSGAWLAAASFVVLLACLAISDQRSDWQRYVDADPDILAELTTPIAPDASVYWPGNIMGVWGGLRRASYFSTAQGAGLVFHRETAAEYRRRRMVVGMLEPGKQPEATTTGPFDSADSLEPTAGLADLREVCGHAGAPDVIVLDHDIPDAKREAWRSPVEYSYTLVKASPHDTGSPAYSLRRVQDFFFYRCRDIVANAP